MIFPWNLFEMADPAKLVVCGKALWIWNRYLLACVKEGQKFHKTLVEYVGFLEEKIIPPISNNEMYH